MFQFARESIDLAIISNICQEGTVMKKVTLFMFAACPYCQKAIAIQNKLLAQETYSGLEIEMIDEKLHPDVAEKYDYYYVPTYYVDGKKLHEGEADIKNVKTVLDAALAG